MYILLFRCLYRIRQKQAASHCECKCCGDPINLFLIKSSFLKFFISLFYHTTFPSNFYKKKNRILFIKKTHIRRSESRLLYFRHDFPCQFYPFWFLYLALQIRLGKRYSLICNSCLYSVTNSPFMSVEYNSRYIFSTTSSFTTFLL